MAGFAVGQIQWVNDITFKASSVYVSALLPSADCILGLTHIMVTEWWRAAILRPMESREPSLTIVEKHLELCDGWATSLQQSRWSGRFHLPIGLDLWYAQPITVERKVGLTRLSWTNRGLPLQLPVGKMPPQADGWLIHRGKAAEGRAELHPNYQWRRRKGKLEMTELCLG